MARGSPSTADTKKRPQRQDEDLHLEEHRVDDAFPDRSICPVYLDVVEARPCHEGCISISTFTSNTGVFLRRLGTKPALFTRPKTASHE